MNIDFKATVLIVDGSSEQLVRAEQMVQDRYHVKLARSGAEAIRLAQQSPRPDLILLEARLPDMDGLAVIGEVQCNFLSSDIPIIYVSGPDGRNDELRALREGASDVIARPLSGEILMARIGAHLQVRIACAKLKDQQRHVAHLVAEGTRAAVELQDATVIAMASLAESRNPDTGNHIRRTQHYVAALARELRFHDHYTAELTDENISLLYKAAPLHDIGKVGVPDAILLKPGRLTDDEFETMKRHTVYGRDAIDGVERTLGSGNQFLRYAREIAYSHQERWDGSGYPQRLAGREIPLAARLMAVADVYDALVTARTYRPAFTHETAMELIRQGRGEHFDPDVVDAMLVVEEKFKAIALQFPAAGVPAAGVPAAGAPAAGAPARGKAGAE